MKRKRQKTETAAAMQAFEDYWALGEERSQFKLHQLYRKRLNDDKNVTVPTTRLRTITQWSSDFNWLERCGEREKEEAVVVRDALRKRSIALRKSIAAGIESNVKTWLKDLKAGEGQLLAQAGDLEKLAKLFFQLAGDPLTDKQEHEITGSMEVEHSGELDIDIPDDSVANVLHILAEAGAFDPGAEADGAAADE